MFAASSYVGMKLGPKIDRELRRARLSQQKAAEMTGIQQAHLSRVINGKAGLSLDQGFALARALGVSLDFLADDTMDAPPETSGALSESDRVILALAKTWGPELAAVRLQNPPPPVRSVPPPDR